VCAWMWGDAHAFVVLGSACLTVVRKRPTLRHLIQVNASVQSLATSHSSTQSDIASLSTRASSASHTLEATAGSEHDGNMLGFRDCALSFSTRTCRQRGTLTHAHRNAHVRTHTSTNTQTHKHTHSHTITDCFICRCRGGRHGPASSRVCCKSKRVYADEPGDRVVRVISLQTRPHKYSVSIVSWPRRSLAVMKWLLSQTRDNAHSPP
jgi:hypothetical protein